MAAENTTQQPQPEFFIQRLYVKDISFESPQAPKVFQETLQPSVNLNIQTSSNVLADDTHDVTVTATITAAVDGRTIFLVEIKQAGIFTIKHIPKDNMPFVLGVTCPTILFPYLREAVSDLVARGGFQHFYLSPINFEALFLANQKETATATKQ
ncbi:MAG: protein-export chaperone SecB [Gammaproteobacteria bacterium]|nr:protein-export chaperone SecB [Gammaproteobacteria bacterium]